MYILFFLFSLSINQALLDSKIIQLNEKELTLALLSLGFDPTPRTLQRFYLASPTGKVDLATVSIYSQ